MSLSADKTMEVAFCRTLGTWLHRADVDKQGAPFILHPEAVAARLYEQGAPWYQIGAAWLHDSVEDGKITMEELRAKVPAEVANLVDVLTRHKGTETYREYIQRVAKTPAAIPVKLADIEHNLERGRTLPGDEGDGLRRRYEKARQYLLAAQAAEGVHA